MKKSLAREFLIVFIMSIVFTLWLISFGLVLAIDWLKGVAYAQEDKITKKAREAKTKFKGTL